MGIVKGATENAAAVQALLDNLIERSLDFESSFLFIVDGSKTLREAIRRAPDADIPSRHRQIR